jgi:hypothetical protein
VNRKRTLAALGRIGAMSDKAVSANALIAEAEAGKIPVRALPPEDADEPPAD